MLAPPSFKDKPYPGPATHLAQVQTRLIKQRVILFCSYVPAEILENSALPDRHPARSPIFSQPDKNPSGGEVTPAATSEELGPRTSLFKTP